METPESVAGAQRRGWGESTLCTIAVLFFLSLAIRLAVWAPVTQFVVPPIYDEVSYFQRAVSYNNILKAYLGGWVFWPEPSEADLKRAYQHGRWPPLHPLLMALGFALGDRGLGMARLIVVLQSAATTCVVFGLTSRLATRRAGLIATAARADHR